MSGTRIAFLAWDDDGSHHKRRKLMCLSESVKIAFLMLRGVFLAGVLVSLLVLVPEVALARGQGYRAGQGAAGGSRQQCGNRTRASHGKGQWQGKGLMHRAGNRWNQVPSPASVTSVLSKPQPEKNIQAPTTSKTTQEGSAHE
jgi:hypothetical protein